MGHLKSRLPGATIDRRFDEAQAELEIAYQLDPLSAIITEGRGYLALLRRDFETAIRVYREILRFDSSFHKAYASMGRAYLQWGKLSEAISAFEEAERLGGATPSVQAGRGQALALAGRTGEALQALARFESLEQARWISHVHENAHWLDFSSGDFDAGY